MDGIVPDCQTGVGCLIPDPQFEGRRILELRKLIIKLAGLVDAGSVLKIAEADLDDLILLGAVEELLKAAGPKEPARDGEGH